MTIELTVQRTVNVNDTKAQEMNALFSLVLKILKWISL